MSGGVDSSVAAALLCRQGYDVVGFTMRLGGAAADWEARQACCGLSELHDARRVADRLGIAHYVLDQTAAFEQHVVAPFVADYLAGRTPNPCLRCNQHVKFASFREHALALGCDAVATGHYAQTARDEASGRWELRRGADAGKDQSYVLYTLTQEQLASVLFPLGALTKREVRQLAGEFGLATAAKPESQEICFVEDNDYAALVRRRAPAQVRPGQIVDADGRELAQHAGIIDYTVGQRRRLGVTAPEPLFVSEIDAARATVTVEPAAAAGRRWLCLTDLHWVSWPPQTGELHSAVQVRYRMAAVDCGWRACGDGATVVLETPLRGIAPGQAAVFYDRAGRVLAGGTIDRTQRDGVVDGGRGQ